MKIKFEQDAQVLAKAAAPALSCYFDCEYNSRDKLTLVVRPWLRQHWMDTLCVDLDHTSTYDLGVGIEWIDANLDRYVEPIIDCIKTMRAKL